MNMSNSKVVKVVISLDRVWVGEGTWNDDCTITNCQALLGRNQDESDETYEELAHELSELPQDEEHWRGPVRIERPEGTYCAHLFEGEFYYEMIDQNDENDCDPQDPIVQALIAVLGQKQLDWKGPSWNDGHQVQPLLD